MSDSQECSQGISQDSSQVSSLEMDCSEPCSDDTQVLSPCNTQEMESVSGSLESNMDYNDCTNDGNDNEDTKDDNNKENTPESSDDASGEIHPQRSNSITIVTSISNGNKDGSVDNNNGSQDVVVNVTHNDEEIFVCVSLPQGVTDKQPQKRKSETEESETKRVKKTRES